MSNTERVINRFTEELYSTAVELGLLLQTGGEFASVTTAICGAVLSGSWWRHQQSSTIYAVLQSLSAKTDLSVVKLLNGKLTFVHKSLWPALIGIGTANEDWQTKNLSPLQRTLLNRCAKEPFLLNEWQAKHDEKLSPAVTVLQRKLLIHTTDVHTPHGMHTKLVQSWQHWAPPECYAERIQDTNAARQKFQLIVKGTKAQLPWPQENT